LMPGQVFFTSHRVNDTVLGVAWWPGAMLTRSPCG
jgi:hypothetical protein